MCLLARSPLHEIGVGGEVEKASEIVGGTRPAGSRDSPTTPAPQAW